MFNTATQSSLSCLPGHVLYSTAVQLLLHWQSYTRIYMCYPEHAAAATCSRYSLDLMPSLMPRRSACRCLTLWNSVVTYVCSSLGYEMALHSSMWPSSHLRGSSTLFLTCSCPRCLTMPLPGARSTACSSAWAKRAH